MKTTIILRFLFVPAAFFCHSLIAQQNFTIDAYKEFLSAHRNVTSAQLQSMYPIGSFVKNISSSPNACYRDSMSGIYKLTEYEQSLLSKHGFVVTERLHYNNFATPFAEIYKKDLPVFISSDAILHALHMSYDGILIDVEYGIIIPSLTALLNRLQQKIPAIDSAYASQPALQPMLRDIDLYISVARRLLTGAAYNPYYADNTTIGNELYNYIQQKQPRNYALFSSTPRTIDFSQFTPRGHYTQSDILTRYFQTMIWLGRTEFYLIPPQSSGAQQTFADVRRQIIDAALISESIDSISLSLVNEIDGLIRMFVGEQDNVTLNNVRMIFNEASIPNAAALLDSQTTVKFQATLAAQSYAFQRINSQILMSDPMNPDQIKPAAAFLLFGQRFVIDSYVTGNVVYDKIVANGAKIARMLPSTQDVLFALGNNASAQLLEKEFSLYPYAHNLTALRYLVDSYDQQFWNSTLFNSWLNVIRSLNPQENRSQLPPFMQTAAWWQEKMNTQLASWAQLRHDNLLYAKQSYSGGITCSYPECYVEPIPAFYKAVKQYAQNGIAKFQPYVSAVPSTVNYFSFLSAIADTLTAMSEKILIATPLTEKEQQFGKKLLYATPDGCGVTYDGWYVNLFYNGVRDAEARNFIIADIHTAPTDAAGNMVGWVVHTGTGPINLAFITAKNSSGEDMTFAGPVMSYYEHVSTNFKRLTDEEWKDMYNVAPSFRPEFVNLYLADNTGGSRGTSVSLLTGVQEPASPDNVPATMLLARNFPNPFNGSTVISFTVPSSLALSETELSIYNIHGQLITKLIKEPLPAGTYTTRWNAHSEHAGSVASGIYFYHLRIGGQSLVGKMSYIK